MSLPSKLFSKCFEDITNNAEPICFAVTTVGEPDALQKRTVQFLLINSDAVALSTFEMKFQSMIKWEIYITSFYTHLRQKQLHVLGNFSY